MRRGHGLHSILKRRIAAASSDYRHAPRLFRADVGAQARLFQFFPVAAAAGEGVFRSARTGRRPCPTTPKDVSGG
jgi:hypothetical protein